MPFEVLAGRNTEITLTIDSNPSSQHKWRRVELNFESPLIPVPGFGDTETGSIAGLPVAGGRLVGWIQSGDAGNDPTNLNGKEATLLINWDKNKVAPNEVKTTMTVLLGSVNTVADTESGDEIAITFSKKANTSITRSWA